MVGKEKNDKKLSKGKIEKNMQREWKIKNKYKTQLDFIRLYEG